VSTDVSLLLELAERPDDRGLRHVLADWLLERGDPRGEVIALCARGELSLTEQRKVARLTTQHGGAWLGRVASVADLHRTRFREGFLHELVCAARPAELFATVAGDPVLATAKGFSLPPSTATSDLVTFLGHRYLAGLERLELGVADWKALGTTDFPHLKPHRVVVSSFGTFRHELRGLERSPVIARAPAMGLATTEFTNAPAVLAILESLEGQIPALASFEELQLVSHYGPMEASATWLHAADTFGRSLPKLQTWALEISEVGFARRRGEDGHFSHLEIDLGLPEGPGERQAISTPQGRPPIVIRMSNASVVMQQLRSAALSSIEIKLPPGAGLRSRERQALEVEARRCSTLRKFTLGGETTILP